MVKFILNDETKKNSHGFHLMNAGGRFERFTDNPVMLHNHDLYQLIGKWLNLRTDGTLLIADPEFDEGDPDAMKIKGKVDRGYLRGASPGIIILSAEWRENPVTHEQEIYVTDWELFEGSVVSVPSNAGALSLRIYDSRHSLVPDDQVACHVQDIIKLGVSAKQTIKTEIHMTEIKLTAAAITALGIAENADMTAISSAIVSLKARLDEKTSALEKREKEADTARQKSAEELVDLAIKEGRIDATKRDSFVKLALADYDTAKTTLDAIPEKQSLAAQIKEKAGASDIPADRKNWTILQWMKNDMAGLKKLQADQPSVYEELKKKH